MKYAPALGLAAILATGCTVEDETSHIRTKEILFDCNPPQVMWDELYGQYNKNLEVNGNTYIIKPLEIDVENQLISFAVHSSGDLEGVEFYNVVPGQLTNVNGINLYFGDIKKDRTNILAFTDSQKPQVHKLTLGTDLELTLKSDNGKRDYNIKVDRVFRVEPIADGYSNYVPLETFNELTVSHDFAHLYIDYTGSTSGYEEPLDSFALANRYSIEIIGEAEVWVFPDSRKCTLKE